MKISCFCKNFNIQSILYLQFLHLNAFAVVYVFLFVVVVVVVIIVVKFFFTSCIQESHSCTPFVMIKKSGLVVVN